MSSMPRGIDSAHLDEKSAFRDEASTLECVNRFGCPNGALVPPRELKKERTEWLVTSVPFAVFAVAKA